LTRPLGSARSAAIAAAFYAAAPVITSSLASGRWDSLVLFAAAPFLLASLLRIDGVSPYGSREGLPGLKVVPRSFPVLIIRYGFLVAFVAAFVPAVVVVGVFLAIAFAGAALITGQGLAPRDFGLAALAAVIAPVSLHLPWSYDVVRQFSWRWLVGPASPEASIPTMVRLLAFAPGRFGPAPFAFGLVAVAVVSLLVAPRGLWRVAVQAWSVTLLMFLLVWAGGRGWVPFALPAADTMLAPALAGLSLAAAVGVRAVESRLGRLVRWRLVDKFVPVVIGGGLLMSLLGAVIMSFHGAWNAPSQSYAVFTQFLADRNERVDRVLWIGDASVLPLDAVVSPSGVQYAVSDGGSPEVWGRWSAGPVGATGGIGQQLDLARSGQTVRLGRLLAPYGIGLVVVLDQLAPAPYEGPPVDPGTGVVRALTQQLDLKREPGVPNLVVFRNDSSAGLAAVLQSAEAVDAITAADQLDVDLSQSDPVDVQVTGSGQWTVTPPVPEVSVLVGVPYRGVEVDGQGGRLLPGFDGLSIIPPTVSTPAHLNYPVPLRRRAGLLLQVLVVGVGAILAQTRREGQP
jgi:hypothetical protein